MTHDGSFYNTEQNMGTKKITPKSSKTIRVSIDVMDELHKRAKPTWDFGITPDDVLREVLGLPANTWKAVSIGYGTQEQQEEYIKRNH